MGLGTGPAIAQLEATLAPCPARATLPHTSAHVEVRVDTVAPAYAYIRCTDCGTSGPRARGDELAADPEDPILDLAVLAGKRWALLPRPASPLEAAELYELADTHTRLAWHRAAQLRALERHPALWHLTALAALGALELAEGLRMAARQIEARGAATP